MKMGIESKPYWWHDVKFMTGLAALTGWFAWAYYRLKPRGIVMHAPHRLLHYDRWAYHRLAYSDIIALYHTRHLYLHLLPYLQNRIEYPVVMGVFLWITSYAPGLLGYFTANAIVLWLSAVGSLCFLREIVPQRYQWFAWTPLLLVYGLLNWDVFGIFLMICGWYLYTRKRYAWAAVVFALAVFFKFFPLFLLPFILVELYRKGQIRTLGKMVAIFVAMSVAINAPFIIGNFRNWSFFFVFNAKRGVGADLWANHWVHALPVATVDGLSFLIVTVGLLWQARRVWQGKTVMSAASRWFALFLLVNKVFSPQYMLWMMAFAIMAEWPIPSYSWLTLGGLVDYVNSFTVLYLIKTHSPFLKWYGDRLFPLGLLMRYGAIAAAAILGSRPSTSVVTHVGMSSQTHSA